MCLLFMGVRRSPGGSLDRQHAGRRALDLWCYSGMNGWRDACCHRPTAHADANFVATVPVVGLMCLMHVLHRLISSTWLLDEGLGCM